MYAFSRAQHITHRLWGAHNKEQIRITYAKADSIQALGDLWQAEQLQRHAYKLHRINYGETSAQAIEASARFGTWLRSIGEYHGSLSHFHDSLIEVQGKGPDLPQSFPLLHGMAHAYRGGYRGKYARSMHKRIIELMAANPNRFSADDRIEAHLEYGDWLMQRFYERPAVKQYEAAWQLANNSRTTRSRWLENLATPELIRYGGMAPHDIDGANRYVTFSFDLTADGRARRVEITEHDASPRERSQALREFPKTIRYRPAIVDGQAVASAGRTARMYLLSPNTSLEPAPVAAPARRAGQTNELLSGTPIN